MNGQELLIQLRRTVEALQVFSDIGKTLTSTLDLKEVLRIVLQKVSELLDPTSWALLLTEEDGEHLRYEIVINNPQMERNQTLRVGQKIAGWVAAHHQGVLWPCPPTKLPANFPSFEVPVGTATLLCTPLMSKGRCLGVIELHRKGKDVTAFTEEDLTTLAVIADFTAIAIENAINFKKIQELTITDDLTTLFNVRHMHHLIDAELDRSSRYQKNCSLIFFDLDHFKRVNDTWGHIYGSDILKEMARVIKSDIRTVDYAARYGGDEFVVLLPETGKSEAALIAERIRKRIEEHVFLKDRGMDIQFTASFGVATFPVDGTTKEEFIKKADEAMYQSKHASRNRVTSA